MRTVAAKETRTVTLRACSYRCRQDTEQIWMAVSGKHIPTNPRPSLVHLRLVLAANLGKPGPAGT